MRKLLIVGFVVLVLFLLWRTLRSAGHYVGAARIKHVALEAGNITVWSMVEEVTYDGSIIHTPGTENFTLYRRK